MPSFSDTSLKHLETCDLRLQLICKEAIKFVDFTIIEGHRGEIAQNVAFANGNSKLPWPQGKHNADPSRAVDVAPIYYEMGARIDWKDVPAFARLAGFLEAIAYSKGIKVRLGMDFDGDWRTAGHDPNQKFLDAPHIELIDQ